MTELNPVRDPAMHFALELVGDDRLIQIAGVLGQGRHPVGIVSVGHSVEGGGSHRCLL